MGFLDYEDLRMHAIKTAEYTLVKLFPEVYCIYYAM